MRRSLRGAGLIRRVLGVIVRVGRICAVVVGHVRGWMRIHISTVGRHEKILVVKSVVIGCTPWAVASAACGTRSLWLESVANDDRSGNHKASEVVVVEYARV